MTGTELESYSKLQQTNQQLLDSIHSLDDIINDNVDLAEELAEQLLSLVLQRKRLLDAWLTEVTAEDRERLHSEKLLTHQFGQDIDSFKQRYAEELAKRKSNTLKVNLYKTLDAKGR